MRWSVRSLSTHEFTLPTLPGMASVGAATIVTDYKF
ncbi:hypothetical protein SAMN06273572_102460 [Monaibacterium marinum]|uniref:Uncharacterized protein n=1 Tax=Pontivivens marinum TaxID=1690039 RepID=A0A2C9CRB6_9RHOB|nr:hypothetical protein SAMN06273572_102460 [Monaibacterium marinum]